MGWRCIGIPKNVFSVCSLMFAGDTGHAPSLPFHGGRCIGIPKNVFSVCLVMFAGDTGHAPSLPFHGVAVYRDLQKCIFPLLVDVCWRHGARFVSTFSWGGGVLGVPKNVFSVCLLMFAGDTGHAPSLPFHGGRCIGIPKNVFSVCSLMFACDTGHAPSLPFHGDVEALFGLMLMPQNSQVSTFPWDVEVKNTLYWNLIFHLPNKLPLTDIHTILYFYCEGECVR